MKNLWSVSLDKSRTIYSLTDTHEALRRFFQKHDNYFHKPLDLRIFKHFILYVAVLKIAIYCWKSSSMLANSSNPAPWYNLPWRCFYARHRALICYALNWWVRKITTRGDARVLVQITRVIFDGAQVCLLRWLAYFARCLAVPGPSPIPLSVNMLHDSLKWLWSLPPIQTWKASTDY